MATEKKSEQPDDVSAQATDLPEKATPLEPGPPQVVPSVMGATFAERAKASKAVQGGENKAVKASETK